MPASKRPAVGRLSSAQVGRPRICLWRGNTHGTSARSRRPARRSTTCPCMLTLLSFVQTTFRGSTIAAVRCRTPWISGRRAPRNSISWRPTSTSSSRTGVRSTTALETRCSYPRRPAMPKEPPTFSMLSGTTGHSVFRRSRSMERKVPATGGKELARSYDVLSELAPLILENQPKGRVDGVLLEDLTPSQRVRLGGYTLNVSGGGPRRIFPGEPVSPEAPRDQSPHGIFIATAPDEFYMAGSGLTITFSADTPGPPLVGLATVEEGRFVDGRWIRGRTLAGDDTAQGNSVSLRGAATGVLRVTVYRYR